MHINSLPSERAAVVATIDPDAYACSDVTPQTSDWVDMSKFDTVMAVALVGTVPATGGVELKLEQATSSAGAGAKDISGKSATALAAAADSDKQVVINVRGEELDVANSFRYVRLSATLTDSASPDAASIDFGAVLLGFDAKYGPASDNDLASVDEIVN